MKIAPESVIDLLHDAAFATLATHSTQLPGYPYATALPCVVDEVHRPLFCISALAEHTKNLLADARASVSLVRADGAAVQAAERMTLIGDVERFEPDRDLVERYLRYQPEAEQYLQLDFMFFRFRTQRVRYIGGLGRMGWLDAHTLDALPALAPSEENALIRSVAAKIPSGIQLLGVDFHGFDCLLDGISTRRRFPLVPGRENLPLALEQALAAFIPESPAI